MVRGRPTSKEWADIKDEFTRLYIGHGKTLSAVKKELAERGFKASDRQFKSKIHSWELNPKKLDRPTYHAMYVVVMNRQQRGLTSTFLVRRGGKWEDIKSESIKKEVNRNGSALDPMNLKDSERLLERDKIMVFPDGDPRINQFKTALQERDAGHEPAGSSQNPFPNFVYDLYSPRIDGNEDVPQQLGRQEHRSSASVEASSWHPFSSVGPNTTIHEEPQVDFSHAGSTKPPTSISDEASTLALIDSLFPHSSHNSSNADPSRSPQTKCSNEYLRLNFDDERRHAARWAAPYLRSLLHRNGKDAEVDWQARQEAKAVFGTMLKRGNPYIFPYCNMMLVILASNHRTTLLTELLTDCCEVIEQDDMGYNLTYGYPFQLTLALYNGKQEEINRYRSEFLSSINAIHMLWGPQSPNYLVTEHYHAWLLLEQGQYSEAVYILNKCLSVCEQVMGYQHLLTINCLAIRARAFSEMGHEAEAIATLHDVLNRLGGCAELLQAYRHRQLMRLAELQTKSHDYVSAESNLRAVLKFRTDHFGITSPPTWEAIEKLVELLSLQGRVDESQRLKHEAVQQFEHGPEQGWINNERVSPS